jgi:hypothetical protein
MRDTVLLIGREFAGFVKSDRWILVTYGILVLAWGFLLAANGGTAASGAGYLWLAFFSVIVSGNFANTTLVAERISGSLEIVLTSGVSRNGFLTGKIAFILIMSVIMGVLCYACAAVVGLVQGEPDGILFRDAALGEVVLLYTAACFTNAGCSAWLSVRITSPRLLPFVNLFVLALIVVAHTVLSAFYALSVGSLILALFVTGALFTVLAYREYAGERIIQPVVY